MSHLEPSYLRYIYDGLEKGDLHPDNAAALPVGLTGLYEAEFAESKPARERQKLLETFAIWALLKKEVSAQFVAEILEIPSQEIVDFIATYSSWFTSPESGKYQLYHERLKVYLLQKLSEKEIATLHNQLLTRLEQAIAEQNRDEFELYGLEFLSVYYFTTAMINGDATKLIAFSYDQNHWQRQLKLSKGFEWTKKGLKQVMTWASKFNDEEVIECGLQMIDLHYQEQNDAPQIVALVADGDIDTALKRIEAFGGNDNEGLQRKFILYMLCLMELTLLESKDKPFRKEAIKKILKHFDDNIPVDHSLLNWNDFFSSYIIFIVTYELTLIGFDFTIIITRAFDFEMKWIQNKNPYTESQLEFLLKCTKCIISDEGKNSAFASISNELAKKGLFEKAVECARVISNEYTKDRAFASIASELTKQGNFEIALECARSINSESDKSLVLAYISSELAIKSQLDKAASAIQEALECAQNISWESDKSSALASLSDELTKLGQLEEAASAMKEALECARNISWESNKSSALASISSGLVKLGQLEEADSAMQEAIECARHINMESDKSTALVFIFSELAKQGQLLEANSLMDEALKSVQNLSDEIDISIELNSISDKLAKQGFFELALQFSKEINDINRKDYALNIISIELSKSGQLERALECARSMKYESNISSALKDISIELYNQGNNPEALYVMHEAIKFACCISPDIWKSDALKEISVELAKQSCLKEAIECVQHIIYTYDKSRALKDISTEIDIKEHLQEVITVIQVSLEYVKGLKPDWKKKNVLNDVYIKKAKLGKVEEAINCIGIDDDYDKSTIIKDISNILAKQGLVEKALECARSINIEKDKCNAILSISIELYSQGKLNVANSIMQEALTLAREMGGYEMCELLKDMSIVLSNQGQIEEALECVYEIKQENMDLTYIRSSVITYIACEIIKQEKKLKSKTLIDRFIQWLKKRCNISLGSFSKIQIRNNIRFLGTKISRLEKANAMLKEAFESAISVYDNGEKTRALIDIANELFKQKFIQDASNVIDSAIKYSKLFKDEYGYGYYWILIAKELAKQGQLDKALSYARNIPNGMVERPSDYRRCEALMEISIEMAYQENWSLSFNISMEISLINVRIECWMKIAEINLEKTGLINALYQVNTIQNQETKTYYLKGLSNNLSANECNTQTVLNSYRYYLNDIESLEVIFQKYALNQLFFENLTEEKIQRYNRTLNIQWAIDIKNQLPN